MKKKIIIGVIILVLVITVIVESILLGVGYYSKVPKLKNGEEKVVSLSTGFEYSVDDLYAKVKDQYALQSILDVVDAEILNKKYKDDKSIATYVETRVITAQTNYPTEDKLNEYLSYFGCNNLDEYRAYLRLEHMKELVGKEQAKADVTNKDIKKYFKDEYIGDIGAKHILVAPKDNDSTAAQNLAKEIIARIDELVKAGSSVDEAFTKAYEEYKSKGDVTSQDLKYFNKGDMVTSFENAAIELKVGSYSSTPVYTQYGYHIIYKYDQKEKGKLEDAKEKITEILADKNYQDNSTLMQTKALKALREENGFTIYDSKLKSNYERYINYSLNK